MSIKQIEKITKIKEQLKLLDRRIYVMFSDDGYDHPNYYHYWKKCGERLNPTIVIRDDYKIGFRKWRYLVEVDFYVQIKGNYPTFSYKEEVKKTVADIFKSEPFWEKVHFFIKTNMYPCLFSARYQHLESAIKVANKLAELPQSSYTYPEQFFDKDCLDTIYKLSKISKI